MVILLRDNSIVGTTPRVEDVPEGFNYAIYEGDTPITQLYYNVNTSTVQLIPPKPSRDSVWNGTQWVDSPKPEFKVSAKDVYIGSNLYKWARVKADTDPQVLKLHITAMCCDAANVRDELRDTVKALRDIRDANANV